MASILRFVLALGVFAVVLHMAALGSAQRDAISPEIARRNNP
jgi:hypothetical protein